MADPMVLPRLAAVRGASARSTTWWGRAFVRSAEETAYDQDDLVAARKLARSGRLGAVMVLASMASVVVEPGAAAAGAADEPRVVAQLKVSGLEDWDGLVAEAAREAGFVAALEAGELPAELLEHADEAGIELLPAAGDLLTACECDAWAEPCRHALALLYQLAWRIDEDPYVLLLLRGRTREWLLEQVRRHVAARVTEGAEGSGGPPGERERTDAASLARRVLALVEQAPGGDGLHAAAVAAYDEQVALLLDEHR